MSFRPAPHSNVDPPLLLARRHRPPPRQLWPAAA